MQFSATPVVLFGSLTATVVHLLHHYGYFALALLIFLEDFGLLVPGETILITAAVSAGAGHLNIWAVMIIAFTAAVLGDNLGYLIGHFGGRPLVLRFGRYVFITPQRLDTAERWFTRHGGKIITVARFIDGLRQANGIIAGITGLRWQRFMLFNALGAALWVGFWSVVGFYTGNSIDSVAEAIGRLGLLGAGLLAITLIGAGLYYHRRRQLKPSDEA